MTVWYNTEDLLPKEGETIAILKQHWKRHYPLSYEISFGVVQESNKETCWTLNLDYTGYGPEEYYLKGAPPLCGEEADYWCYLDRDWETDFIA